MRRHPTAIACVLATMLAAPAASAYDLCLTAEVAAVVYVQVGTASPLTFSGSNAPCQQTSAAGDVKAGVQAGQLESCYFSVAAGNTDRITVKYEQKQQRFPGDPLSERCER